MPYNPKYLPKDYEYRKNHFKRVGVDVQKEYYAEVLKPAADRVGESVNGYIKKAIDERIERENAAEG